jgi:hypothetical protein
VVETPTVATPVAGFRELAGRVTIAPAPAYADAVRAVLDEPPARASHEQVFTWRDRAAEFRAVLARAGEGRVAGGRLSAV